MKNIIKGLSISMLVLGSSFTATYMYLDVTNKEENTVTQTTVSSSTKITVPSSTQTENSTTENTPSYKEESDAIYMPYSTKKMKLTNGGINTIEGELWKMLPNNHGSMILVAYSDDVYNNEFCDLQVSGDSWLLVSINTNQIIAQGDVIND